MGSILLTLLIQAFPAIIFNKPTISKKFILLFSHCNRVLIHLTLNIIINNKK